MVVPRFFDEVPRPAAHRLDGDVDGAPGSHHNDGQRRIERLQLQDQIEPFATGGGIPRVVQVDDRHVEDFRAHGFEQAGGRAHGGHAHAVVLEQQAHGGEHVLLVVGDDDARGVDARDLIHGLESTRAAYSQRSADDGWTRSARRAGIQLASIEVTISRASTIEYTAGSSGDIPSSPSFRARPMSGANMAPSSRPTPTWNNAPRMTAPRICRSCAPSARRTPISRFRWPVANTSTP